MADLIHPSLAGAITTVVRFSADNDDNGNPQRVFVAFAGPYFAGAYDEGYDGYRCVPVELIDLARYCLTVSVPVDEYQKFLTWHEEASDNPRMFERIAQEALRA